MHPQALSQEAYLSGSYHSGLHVESGTVYSCYTPPTINNKRLAIPASICELSSRTEKMLAAHPPRCRAASANHVTYHSSPTEKRGGKQEIRNYHKAKQMLIKALADMPLTVDLVCEANRLLLQGARGQDKTPGELRKRVSRVLDIETLEVSYVPPHYEKLLLLLCDLEGFWANDSLGMPKLVHIAIAQYQFIALHPFNDGNGRTGRLISELLIWKYGLINTPWISLDAYFEKNRLQYHSALRGTTRMTGHKNIYSWIEFFLEGISCSS